MFENFFDFVESQLAKEWQEMNPGTRSFRETPNYQKRFQIFGDTLRAHLELKERGNHYDGLEPLMVEAHRFLRFLRKEGNLEAPKSPVDTRPIDTAIYEAMSILDEPLDHCIPLRYEAEALEILSFSAWKVLKEKGLVKHCKYCQQWLNGPCKKHKEPSTVEDLFYCKVCTGWLSTLCVVHGPEASL